MSKRTERRAAERAAHKAARIQKLTQTQTTPAAEPVAVPAFTIPTAATPVTESAPKSTTSAAQINANRANSQKSTGPTTESGKKAVSQNAQTHGLSSRFSLLPWENKEKYHEFMNECFLSYEPKGTIELRLLATYIQHYWLAQRAILLQEEVLVQAGYDTTRADPKKLALFLRYQTTHERSYYRAQKEFLNLKKEKAKQQIGFDSQKRKQEADEAKARLANAKAEALEIDTAARKVMDAPLPDTERISFEELTKACSDAIAATVIEKQQKSTASAPIAALENSDLPAQIGHAV